MRAIVTGMIATYPVGGIAWDYGQYALGLERMGWEVYYLEDNGVETYDPVRREYGCDPAFGIRFLEQALSRLSPTLGERWHFRAVDGTTYGVEAEQFRSVVGEADLFLNVSGGTLLRDEYMANRCKVLIDTDPGWNQFVNFPRWDANPGWQGTHGYRAHDYFFTYAERIGRPGCKLPDLGLNWKPTRPPVVMDCWKPEPPADTWTTVMTWNNFHRPVEREGELYGTKEMEFPKVEALPTRVHCRLEVAVGGSSPPVEHWRELGWNVVDSHSVSASVDDYRSYIQRSRGEFSVAKNLYTATRCGWFSCRSVCYLAAGRPCIVQDTGFSEIIPTSRGLFAFNTLEEAVEAFVAIERDYAFHQQGAIDTARYCFDAPVVLAELLREVGMA